MVEWQTIVTELKYCAQQKDLRRGIRNHADIGKEKLLESDASVASALIDMYTKCGYPSKAQEVFDAITMKEVAIWNALLAAYVQNGQGERVLIYHSQMRVEGILPNEVTFSCILKACGSVGATNKSQEVHAEISGNPYLDSSFLIATSLIYMYTRCGSLENARKLFDMLPVRDTVMWSILIGGYSDHGCYEEAINLFGRMQLEDICPNVSTFVAVLKACAGLRSSAKGQEVYAEICKYGLLEREVLLGTTLVDMYVKCGLLAKAEEAFQNILIRDVISWNALISGYVENELFQDALFCFVQMQHEGITPDQCTFVCSLKACGSMGAPNKGREIHLQMLQSGTMQSDLLINTALVDMYAKCGLVDKAHEVFNQIEERDVVMWNTLILGYAQFGHGQIVFDLFNKMITSGIKPDLVSFITVLYACSSTGLVDKGQMYFETMIKKYAFIPQVAHYNCIFDLFGRSGRLDEVASFIKKMPFHADIVVWHTMMLACWKWGNVELGRKVFRQAIQVDWKDPLAYLTMYSIIADADSKIMRIALKQQGFV